MNTSRPYALLTALMAAGCVSAEAPPTPSPAAETADLVPDDPTPFAPTTHDAPLSLPEAHTSQTLRVRADGSGDFRTLTRAIAHAEAGDILLIGPGRYGEAPTISQKPLILQGDGPREDIILDGEGAESTLTLLDIPPPGVRIEGISITGSLPGGGDGIAASETTLTLSDVAIYGNGHGVRLFNSDVQILRSEIRENVSSSGGAGLLVEGFGHTTLTNTLIARNEGTVGGGILLNGGSLLLRHTVLLGNAGTAQGGAIYVQSHPVIVAQLQIQNAIIAHTTQGAGIYVNDPLVELEVLGTVFWDNARGDLAGEPFTLREDLGNARVDPGFVGVWPEGDFADRALYLRPTSPLVNAAVGEGWDPDGSRADIGLHGGLQARFAYYEDRDGDGLYDGWEMLHGLEIWRRDTYADPDLDGLSNILELAYGTDPRRADTDRDGVGDLAEIGQGYDPVDPFSPRAEISLPDQLLPLDVALLRAPEGAVIHLGDGVWQGRFSPMGKAVQILGAGRGRTILDGGGLGPILRFEQGEGPGTRVAGLTVRGGLARRGGGVAMIGASPTLEDLRIVGNTAEVGGGLHIQGGAPSLTGLEVEGNQASGGGGGVFISGGATTLTKSLIARNSASNGGGIAFSEGGDHSLEAIELRENVASNSGGGFSLLGETQLRAEGLLIAGNQAYDGGGIYAADGSLDLRHSTLVNNRADLGGALALLAAPHVKVTASIIAYTARGGGLLDGARREGLLTLEAVLFWANAGGDVIDEGGVALPWPAGASRGDPYFWAEPSAGTFTRQGLYLGPRSAALDLAPGAWTDADGSPADLGVTGGPTADARPLRDRDEDGLPDGWESLWDLDPESVDPGDDLDGDGLTNSREYALGLNPTRRDTDRDGLEDGDEVADGGNPRAPIPILTPPGEIGMGTLRLPKGADPR